MGKIHLQDLERYEEDLQAYQPIKTNKKKKVSPIYNKDQEDTDQKH
jgi:hypothetical protein